MKLAIIGAGRLGRALGKRLAAAGHEVVYARGAAARRAAFAHPGARAAATNSDAVRDAEVTILAVPFSGLADALAGCGTLDGKLLWSCVTALQPESSGGACGAVESAAEVVARLAPHARVVAALPPCAEVIAAGANPFDGARPTSWMCGGTRRDQALIGGLLRAIGADPVDAGELESARLVESAMALVARQAHNGPAPRTLALRMIEQGWEQLDRPLGLLA